MQAISVLNRVVVTILVLGAALARVSPAASQPMPQGGPPPPIVEAQIVGIEAIFDSLRSVGTLQSDQSIVVRPEINGLITKIHVAEGARVKAGEVLFSLDDVVLQAEMKQAEARLKLSLRNFDRARDLFERGAGTVRARDEALSNLETDKAALALASARLQKTRIVAPFAGVVGLRQVDLGDYVRAGDDLVSLDDLDPIKMDFSVPERYLRFLAEGQKVSVNVDALPSRSFEGEIYAISPRIDPDGRSLAIRARVPNTENRLRPGLFARVEVTIAERPSAVVIPEQAIFPRGDRLAVYRIVDGKAQIAFIQVGLRRFGKAEVSAGLEPGEMVIVSGHVKVRDGSPVRTIEPAAGSAR